MLFKRLGCVLVLLLAAQTAFAQQGIWSAAATPGPMENEVASVELGLKFKSDTAGVVTGLRFYKYAQNSGTHVGNLWSATGTLLGTVTFSNESASGWQQATFVNPLTIAANTTYIVSYH